GYARLPAGWASHATRAGGGAFARHGLGVAWRGLHYPGRARSHSMTSRIQDVGREPHIRSPVRDVREGEVDLAAARRCAWPRLGHPDLARVTLEIPGVRTTVEVGLGEVSDTAAREREKAEANQHLARGPLGCRASRRLGRHGRLLPRCGWARSHLEA